MFSSNCKFEMEILRVGSLLITPVSAIVISLRFVSGVGEKGLGNSQTIGSKDIK